MKRPLATLTFALACLALAGCAERQSQSQYEENLQRLYEARQQVMADAPNQQPGDISFYAKAQDQMRRAADDLDAIQPPRGLEMAHERHVEGLRGLSRVLGKFADCGRLYQRDQDRGMECRTSLDQLELDEVRNDLHEADTIYRQQGFTLTPGKSSS